MTNLSDISKLKRVNTYKGRKFYFRKTPTVEGVINKPLIILLKSYREDDECCYIDVLSHYGINPPSMSDMLDMSKSSTRTYIEAEFCDDYEQAPVALMELLRYKYEADGDFDQYAKAVVWFASCDWETEAIPQYKKLLQDKYDRDNEAKRLKDEEKARKKAADAAKRAASDLASSKRAAKVRHKVAAAPVIASSYARPVDLSIQVIVPDVLTAESVAAVREEIAVAQFELAKADMAIKDRWSKQLILAAAPDPAPVKAAPVIREIPGEGQQFADANGETSPMQPAKGRN